MPNIRIVRGQDEEEVKFRLENSHETKRRGAQGLGLNDLETNAVSSFRMFD